MTLESVGVCFHGPIFALARAPPEDCKVLVEFCACTLNMASRTVDERSAAGLTLGLQLWLAPRHIILD